MPIPRRLPHQPVLALAASLTACGGGGSSNSGSAHRPHRPRLPLPSCAIASTRPWLRCPLMGVTGSAQFSSNGSVLTYSGGLTGTLNLVNDARRDPFAWTQARRTTACARP